jgi:hypothetical protein
MARQPVPDPLQTSETPFPARVDVMGLGLLHVGDLVIPSEGSEVGAHQVMDDARATIQYYFPVEVEICDVGGTGTGGIDIDTLADRVLQRLADNLNNT